MAFGNDEIQEDLDLILDNLWSDLRSVIRTWDHKNGGGNGRSNKQIYLAAQKITGEDIPASPDGFNRAVAVLVTAAASRVLYPGMRQDR